MSAPIWSKILQFFPTLLNGNSGATPAIDWNQGSVQKITLNAATVTPTFKAPIAGCNLALVITQDGTGGRAVTWPAAVSWIGGTAPILLSGAGQTTLVYFYWDGTTYWGSLQSGASPQSIIPWTAVAAGTALAASLSNPNLACDTSGTQSNVTLPSAAAMANSDGFEFTIKNTGNMVSPVIVTAGAGTTVGLLNAPGTFGASTWMPIQGQGATFKYDLSTTTWKVKVSTEGSGAPGTSAYNPNWFTKTVIYWDPTSGIDSDTGAIGHPLLTITEVVRRYGSSRVTLPYAQSVQINQLTAQPAGQDPVFIEFNCSGGGNAVLNCVSGWTNPGVDFAAGALGGGFGSVGATPSAGGTGMTVAGVPGYVVAGTLLYNVTRDSYAMVKAVAAGTATCGQPTKSAGLVATNVLPALVVDNTWAATDTLRPFTTTPVNLKRFTAFGGDLSAGQQPSAAFVIGASVADPSGAALSELGITNNSACTSYALCNFATRVHIAATQGRGSVVYLSSCYFAGAMAGYGGGPMQVAACVCQAGLNIASASITITNNTLMSGSVTLTNFAGGITIGAGGCWSDSTWTFASGSAGGAIGFFWGSWGMVLEGTNFLNATGSTWVLKAALTTGNLRFGGGVAVGMPPSNSGTFTLNGVTQVNVPPSTGHFPANAKIALSLNTVGGTPGTAAPYFSAAQIADQFSVKSPTANANDVYNWIAFGGSVSITPANIDLYGSLIDEATGARYCALAA